jgi:hypothetical protein
VSGLEWSAVSSLRSSESDGRCPNTVSATRSNSLRVFVSYGILFATLVAISSTDLAFRSRVLAFARALPRITGPFRLATEVHLPMELCPCRVSRFLLAVRPVGRTNFLEIPRPSNGVP